MDMLITLLENILLALPFNNLLGELIYGKEYSIERERKKLAKWKFITIFIIESTIYLFILVTVYLLLNSLFKSNN